MMKEKLMHISATLIIVSSLTGCQKASSTSNLKASQAPLASLKDAQTMKDPLELPVAVKVQGPFAKAFLTAYDSFSTDAMIPDNKRHIDNYEIEFRQSSDTYFILFFAKRKANERNLQGGESELGKDVLYTIKKDDFSLADKKFFK